MFIKVKTTHIDMTDAMRDYAIKKMEKLETFYDSIEEVCVDLHIEDAADVNARQICYVTAYAPGHIVRAEESSKDLYASIDIVFDKLSTQLKKIKEKAKDRRSDTSIRQLSQMVRRPKDKTAAESALDPSDLYIKKPMEEEVAIEHLRDHRLPFLMYRNFHSEKINVLYPTGNNEYGIIEA